LENIAVKRPELLAPAGNFEKLKIAVRYGADAVYLGGRQYSLRAHAGNFSETELAEAVLFAHGHGVKVYAAANIFAHNQDLQGLAHHLRLLREVGVDGVIISDPGVLSMARQTVPELPIHLSTQANVTNLASARFWADQGVRRLNLARELSLAEIREIRRAVSCELEIFVHGAVCISYSGRCLLSLYLTGRHPNRGDCAHPCRYLYRLEEEKRPGQFFPVEEDSRGTYIMNSKDLCLLPRLGELIEAGADSFKIEGRMKSTYYVGGIVRLYRAALDFFLDQGSRAELPAAYFAELSRIGSRGGTDHFLTGPPDGSDMLYDGITVRQEYGPAGIVREGGPRPLVEVRNPITVGEELEYLAAGLENVNARIEGMETLDGQPISRANPNQLVRLFLAPPARGWEPLGLVRKRLT